MTPATGRKITSAALALAMFGSGVFVEWFIFRLGGLWICGQ
jgi:hypothetical protein